jgi:uncharacterized membrane protein YcaP (DUF421 family)
MAIIAIGFVHWATFWLRSHFPRLGAIIDGAPLVLIENGVWREEAMHGAD